MNYRSLNRWLVVPNVLLVAAIMGGMAMLAFHRSNAQPIRPPDLKSVSPHGNNRVVTNLKPVDEYALIFNAKTSLMNATAAAGGEPGPVWEAMKLLQAPTQYRGRWEAFVQVPNNPMSYNPTGGPWNQLVVRVGDTIQMPPNPAASRGRASTPATVTATAIGANSITLMDANGEERVIQVGQ